MTSRNISAVSNDAVVQRLSKLLVDWAHDHRAVLYVLVALAVGFAIGRYRANHAYPYQNRGEALLSRVVQTNFGPPDYHLMNHVTLRLKDGTTQIDHVLVSRFGVFVIETKDYKGWIFANGNQAKWTQVLFRYRFKFQNPIFQNDRHVRAVRGLLDFLPPDAIKSVVVFTGDAKFKTVVPEGVFCVSKVVDYLREHTVAVMSLNRVQLCVGRLETARLAMTGETDVEQVMRSPQLYDTPTTTARPRFDWYRRPNPDPTIGRWFCPTYRREVDLAAGDSLTGGEFIERLNGRQMAGDSLPPGRYCGRRDLRCNRNPRGRVSNRRSGRAGRAHSAPATGAASGR